jgi:threonyl-tRNA synthetase
MQLESEHSVLRPMTCPHHCLLYSQKLRSYRELPIIYFENSLLHRKEFSGALTGLERVRAMELADTHAFCTLEQINKVMGDAIKIIQKIFKDLKLNLDYVSLSVRDPKDKKNFYGNGQM